MAARVYVGGIDPKLQERDLEDEFIRFGTLRSVWVARKPPGFAFIEFEDTRDAEDAIRKLDGGPQGWRVEFSRRDRGGPRGGGGDRGPPRDSYRGGSDRGGGGGMGGGGMRSDMKCYECGDPGHFARECPVRTGGGGGGGGDRGGGDRGGGSRYGDRDDRDGGRGGGRDRDRSPPPRRRSPSYEAPRARRSPSYEPRRRSPSYDAPRGGDRERSASPAPRD